MLDWQTTLKFSKSMLVWIGGELLGSGNAVHSPRSASRASKHVALVPNSLPITSNQLSSASFAYYTSTMLAYFKQKRQWSDVTFLSIDWLVSDKEYQQLSTEHHLLSFKLQNVLWSTHHVHHLYKSAQSHSCTSCCLIPEAHNRVSVAGGGAIYPP